jgi:hypothetical protein
MRLAERTGFEPAEGSDAFTDLANRRIRPLCHLSRDDGTYVSKTDTYFTPVSIGCKSGCQHSANLLWGSLSNVKLVSLNLRAPRYAADLIRML